ncbi:MAG: CRTAC1 family protein [Proteobacteria bacterium]|nr:CRTAC1 family protein [Pseudomonadota bacterium]
MGVIAADFDNDGNNDLFMTHLFQESNTMYRNFGGDRGFVDVTSEVGLSWSSIPYTGFGAVAFDVELDGDLDIFLVNGRVKREPGLKVDSLPPPWAYLAEPNLFYVNQGNGRFKQVTGPVASVCEPVEVTRGLAIGDLDSDGDLDIVLSNVHGPARVYRNDTPRQGNWLIVRAYDSRYRRDAIGARITVVCSPRRYVRTVGRARGYLSSSDVRAHFGLGKVARVDRIEVDWPDGLREWFSPTRTNIVVELVRGTGTKQ